MPYTYYHTQMGLTVQRKSIHHLNLRRQAVYVSSFFSYYSRRSERLIMLIDEQSRSQKQKLIPLLRTLPPLLLPHLLLRARQTIPLFE